MVWEEGMGGVEGGGEGIQCSAREQIERKEKGPLKLHQPRATW